MGRHPSADAFPYQPPVGVFVFFPGLPTLCFPIKYVTPCIISFADASPQETRPGAALTALACALVVLHWVGQGDAGSLADVGLRAVAALERLARYDSVDLYVEGWAISLGQ